MIDYNPQNNYNIVTSKKVAIMNSEQLAKFHLEELNGIYEIMTDDETTDQLIIDLKVWYTEWYLYHLSYGNLNIADVYFNLIERIRELERQEL
jgi:hypothetical protein